MTIRPMGTAAAILLFLLLCAPSIGVAGDAPLRMAAETVIDEKAVFATVESVNVVPARARIGGTVVDLSVAEGDRVAAGQTIARIGDEKLALQIGAMDSRISALNAQFEQAATELARARELFAQGAVSRARLDDAQTQYNVAENAHKAATAERNVIRRQVGEGDILAPVSGRVLSVPVTRGTVVMPGETAAMVAEENYILRLRLPERHARFLKVGDDVRLDDGVRGRIVTVYPQMEQGRVVADAAVDGLGDYFVGERVRVFVAAGERSILSLPGDYLTTRYGIDYVRLLPTDGGDGVDVPVQRGRILDDGRVEILSGLRVGDRVVRP